MTTAFLPVDQAVEFPKGTIAPRWFVVGHRSRREIVESMERQGLFDADVGFGIIPIGPLGQRQWHGLSFELARLVSPPWNNAVCVVPHDSAALPLSVDALWQRSATSDSPCHVFPPFPGPALWEDLPALAPRPRALPRWLANCLAEFPSTAAVSPIGRQALAAGLLQVHDRLDASHERSQAIEGQGRHRDGDYWHAIMHRREPDYGNSKYWFRRVGAHPIFEELGRAADEILTEASDPFPQEWTRRLTGRGWDPFAFVDLCERAAHDENGPLGLAARRIQWAEMLLLLNHTRSNPAG